MPQKRLLMASLNPSPNPLAPTDCQPLSLAPLGTNKPCAGLGDWNQGDEKPRPRKNSVGANLPPTTPHVPWGVALRSNLAPTDCQPLSLAPLGTNKPNTEVAPEMDRAGTAPNHGTQTRVRIAPAPTAKHAVRPRGRTHGIRLRHSRVRTKPIPDPFQYVPAHIIKP